LKRLTGPGRRQRLAVGLTIVVLGLLGAAVGLSRPTQAPDAPAERAVVASKPAVLPASKPKSVPSAREVIRKQMPDPVGR
jgi:hypothetical protein